MTTRHDELREGDTVVALASADYDDVTAYKDYQVLLRPCVITDAGAIMFLDKDDLGNLVGFEKIP